MITAGAAIAAKDMLFRPRLPTRPAEDVVS
jgi:hypothetical protein